MLGKMHAGCLKNSFAIILTFLLLINTQGTIDNKQLRTVQAGGMLWILLSILRDLEGRLDGCYVRAWVMP